MEVENYEKKPFNFSLKCRTNLPSYLIRIVVVVKVKATDNSHPPLHILNKLSPLSDTLAVKTILIIGSSVLQNVKLETPVTRVKYIPGPRVGGVESNLKLLANHKFSTIAICSRYNDSHLLQSEVTKIHIKWVCIYK